MIVICNVDSWVESANSTERMESCTLPRQIPATDSDHLPLSQGAGFVFSLEQIAVDDMSDTQKGRRKTV